MQGDASGLPKSVFADANIIQMVTLQVPIWAKNPCVRVSQWAAETIAIWQDEGGLTIQLIDIKVNNSVWEISQSMYLINMQSAGPEQWDLAIDCCGGRISDLLSKRPLWKWHMGDKTNLNG